MLTDAAVFGACAAQAGRFGRRWNARSADDRPELAGQLDERSRWVDARGAGVYLEQPQKLVDRRLTCLSGEQKFGAGALVGGRIELNRLERHVCALSRASRTRSAVSGMYMTRAPQA